MYADAWNCVTCHHGEEYKCPLKHEINREELLAIAEENREGLQPLIFAADESSICPRCLVTDWGGYIWQAYQWQEAGGDLGVPFTKCPQWLFDAFNLLATERHKANDLKMKK